MKELQVKITTGKGENKVDYGEFPYPEPETLEEGIAVDGVEKVYALYKQQRKIRWMDAKRAECGGGPKSEARGILAAIKKLAKDNPEALKQVAAALGVPIPGVD